MRTTATMSSLWGPAKQTWKMGYFTFSSGARVFVRRELFPALREVDRILVRYGYAARTADTGGYNPRYIDGTRVWSLHAFGIAIDINWLLNPAGGHLVTNMPRAMVEEIEAIVTNNGVRVFRWGGDWNDNEKADESFYDAMHFEAQASPSELAAGIRVAPAVPKPEPAPTPQPLPPEADPVSYYYVTATKQAYCVRSHVLPAIIHLDSQEHWDLAVGGAHFVTVNTDALWNKIAA